MAQARFLFSFMITTLLAVSVFAGISTNGGAITLEENNVWFLGPEPIEYCIRGDSGDKVSERQAEKIIAQSFRERSDFFKSYKLDQIKFKNLKDRKSLELALSAKLVSACTPGKQQIQFLLGIENDQVLRALEKDEGALALAVRGFYDHDTYRNGGTIYFRNLNGGEEKFHHMVLHELGHIFGMPHDSVHVMDSKVAYWMTASKVPKGILGRIETPTWPYKARVDVPVDFTFNSSGGESNQKLAPLLSALGFSNEGKHSLELIWKSRAAQNAVNQLVIREEGSGKTHVLPGKFNADPAILFENLGPRVHLLMLCSECTNSNNCADYCGPVSYGMTRYLDHSSDNKVFNGVFQFGPNHLPAIIDETRGISLKIFSPFTAMWWTTSLYDSSYFLRPPLK